MHEFNEFYLKFEYIVLNFELIFEIFVLSHFFFFSLLFLVYL